MPELSKRDAFALAALPLVYATEMKGQRAEMVCDPNTLRRIASQAFRSPMR